MPNLKSSRYDLNRSRYYESHVGQAEDEDGEED